jgi:hypothetical protein
MYMCSDAVVSVSVKKHTERGSDREASIDLSQETRESGFDIVS